jgi:lysophospholipase L1-like esterase
MKLTRRKSLLINLALAASSLLCFLGGLEAVAWFWEQRQAQGPHAWELVASRRIQLDRFATSSPGYTLMHPRKAYTWQAIPVQINDRGLRGPEVSLSKPPGTYRILNLGDSVVFGWGVRYEDTYGHQLQLLLDERHAGEGTRYEVINAGVPGWNVENALAYLQAEGLDYGPDLILLNFTVVNDVYGGNALEGSSQSPIEWLREHTYFWPFLTVQRHLLLVRLGRKEAIPVLNPPEQASAYFPLDEGHPRWDVIWKPIHDMAALADAHGSDFFLVVLPTAFQVRDAGYPKVPQQVLGARAKEEGIETLDLLPLFQRACREAPAGEVCGPEGRYLWAEMWMHPSALGHRLMAERILSVLEQNEWH